ncbi:Lrp/AsnC family transcriptional regulator [Agromyces sp. NPDC056965]|uniref:Lrp/AsnC family transcriptional regulator n=1 Tax=Agromyces sp. NPDC056965 TaxID=3345983 RepID=UPI0036334F1D
MSEPTATPRLDNDIDQRIVSALAADGRTTLATLATLTGLSTSAVQSRVQRLEQRGVITGYRAVIDPQAVGLPVSAFLEISVLDPATVGDLGARLGAYPEIESCYAVSGDAGHLAVARVATTADLAELLVRLRTAIPAQVRATIVLRTLFESRPFTASA